MQGDTATLEAVLEHLLGEHRRGVQARVAGVVDQHRDAPAVGGGERAHPAYVLACVLVRVLDPRDAADHIRAEVDGLADELLGAGVAQQTVLREGDHLQVDHAAELLPQRQQRGHALEPRRGVHVGEREHVPHAVPHRLQDGPARVRLDPRAVVLGLHRGGELDRAPGRARVTRGVRRECGISGPVEGVHLVEVQVGIHEALGDQPARDDELMGGHAPVIARGLRVCHGRAARAGLPSRRGRGTRVRPCRA